MNFSLLSMANPSSFADFDKVIIKTSISIEWLTVDLFKNMN